MCSSKEDERQHGANWTTGLSLHAKSGSLWAHWNAWPAWHKGLHSVYWKGSVCDWGRRNCISSHRRQWRTRGIAVYDLTPEKEKFTFLVAVLAKRGFSCFLTSLPGDRMLCPPQNSTAHHQMEGIISKTQWCFKKSGQIFWPCMCVGMHLVL